MSLGVCEALRHGSEWLKSKFVATGIILLYHRIADLPSDPQLLSVRPHHFAEHLEIITRKCMPLALTDLKTVLEDKDPPAYPVAITFDDGYADNLTHAKPLLERYGVPMTVFVTSGYIGSTREFWWDDLERLMLQSVELPEVLNLSINGSVYEWKLNGNHDTRSNPSQNWNVQTSDDPTPRHRLYRSLCELMRPLSEEARRVALDTLTGWARTNPKGRLTHLPLTAEELTALAKGGLVTIGAHTVSHALLSGLPKPEQKEEILNSKIALEEILGRTVSTFGYPYGARGDYTNETINLVRHAGFDLACANFPAAVWRRSDGFQLPRLLVRDWDGETFERWLSGWMSG